MCVKENVSWASKTVEVKKLSNFQPNGSQPLVFYSSASRSIDLIALNVCGRKVFKTIHDDGLPPFQIDVNQRNECKTLFGTARP